MFSSYSRSNESTESLWQPLSTSQQLCALIDFSSQKASSLIFLWFVPTVSFSPPLSQFGDRSIAGISNPQPNAGAGSSTRSPGHCGWLCVFISIVISSVTLGWTQRLQGCVCKFIVNQRNVNTGASIILEWFQSRKHFSFFFFFLTESILSNRWWL